MTTLRLRWHVLKRDEFRCRYCGRSAVDGAVLQVDHVKPDSRGGPTTMENLVTACRECNLGKRADAFDESFMPMPLEDLLEMEHYWRCERPKELASGS